MKKRTKRQTKHYNAQKPNDRATRTPLKTRDEVTWSSVTQIFRNG